MRLHRGGSSGEELVEQEGRSGCPCRAPRHSPPLRRGLVPGATLTAIVVLGVTLVVFARGERDAEEGEPPLLGDHWHAAYGIYDCDTFLPPVQGDMDRDRVGLHTHSDGLVHIEPRSSAVTGPNATFGRWTQQYGLELDEQRIRPPGSDGRERGDECAGKAGEVRAVTWDGPNDDTPQVHAGDPDDIRLRDNQLITVAFVARDMDTDDLPKPPSTAELPSRSADAEPTTTLAPTTPPSSSPETTTSTAPPATPAGSGTTRP